MPETARGPGALMRGLPLALFLACASAQAFAEPPAIGTDPGGEKAAHLHSLIGTLSNFESFLDSYETVPADQAVRRFADNAHFNRSIREAEWRLFDSLLGGGKLDEDGNHIRAALSELTPKDWYFVIRLEEHRRQLMDMHGNGPLGNVTENVDKMVGASAVDYERYGRLCYERADQLLGRMKIVRDTWDFKGWTFRSLMANPTRKTIVLVRSGEHHAPCFELGGDDPKVELVADAWAGGLVPARVWWREWDKEAYEALGPGGRFCGRIYDRYEHARMQAIFRKQAEGSRRTKKDLDGVKSRIERLKEIPLSGF